MSQTTFIAPVETIRGKLTGHRADDRVLVNRRKCFGKDAKGRPYYGPSETYIYHIHQGKWSDRAEQNRTLFQNVQLLAKQELSDPERLAYWQSLFEQQFKHAKQGEKHYATLRGFVIAQIHQQMKENAQNP